MITIGADVGKYKTKIKWRGGIQSHLSSVSTFRELRGEIPLDDQNMIIEYENQKFFVGDLADREGQNYLNSPDWHKSNTVTLINLFAAVSRIPSTDFSIVVGNPFGINTPKERERLKSMIVGTKHFKVNHKDYRVTIHNVGVAPEGMAAYYSVPLHNDLNILDFGSSTIHAIAIRNRRLTDSRSHTFDFGFESLVDTDYRSIMQGIKFKLEKKWGDFNKRIMLIGGMASEMDAFVKEQYPNSQITIHHNQHFANALGMYEMGKVAYERAN
ncbi:ParM/StbA family protein [Chengkuizengella axinellae]|uniref:ParM/StbA family protein n=1 Tax=Chengkuizengella axinellae TaxID=3064388 RepID=A0ABT9J0V8_9BACL|nr:ParM/StbA family protein [Chengkuizengella sp. 2205SS18-9]MDP5275254.1 ParM/StbA family protein [Chengkuizengella sp. 2205SS18-9]